MCETGAALLAQRPRAPRAVELLGLAGLDREAVAGPGLHSALDDRRLIATLSEVGGDVRAALAVRAHDHYRAVFIQGFERGVDLVTLGPNRTRDVCVTEVVLIPKVKRLDPFARDQLAASIRIEGLLFELRLHQYSATPTGGGKTSANASRQPRSSARSRASWPPVITGSPCDTRTLSMGRSRSGRNRAASSAIEIRLGRSPSHDSGQSRRPPSSTPMSRSPATRARCSESQNMVSPAPRMGHASTPSGSARLARDVRAE